MTELSLSLCGRVTVTGDVVQPAAAALSAKALALLAYLALEPGPHSRDRLASLLWGECPDAKAKASLRQALVHLRETLPTIVSASRSSVELVGPAHSDVGTFLRLAKEAPRDAAECNVFGFLDGLHLRHCPAFDEWADGMRATLSRRLTEVLAAVTREALATRTWRDAVRFADRWVAVAPLSATANASLMEAHFMSGDRELALDAFAQYRTRLAEDNGDTPAKAVTELAERIRAATPTPRQRHATEEWYATAPSFEGSLVGRAGEWESLTRAWTKASQGRARVALIEGEAGVGKTRIVGDFLRWVAGQAGTVLRGRGYDVRGGVPFGAMIEALRSGVDAPGLAGTDPQWLAEVARVVPELRVRFPAVGAPAPTTAADAWRLFEGVAQVLGALAEEAPVTVLIDDLQWCDADSCTLLHALVRKLDAAPILWCLTFSPGSVERDAPAARLVRALRSFPHTDVLTLHPLTEDDVWQLLRTLGRVREPNGARRLAARIHEVTTGYPFYVIELLKTLFAQGWLTVHPETGEWIVRAQDAGDALALALTSAPTVHEAIAERIECLPDELSAVLISIAVSARGCSANVLSHVHGISRLRAAMAGDALAERQLAVEENGVYRCAHPLIARVVSEALNTSRRREVHRGLALALELVASEGGTAAEPGEIARHAEQGGARAMAYRYAMLTVAACEARFAYAEALTWLDFAAAAGVGPGDMDTVNRTTARLLENAGLHEPPRVERPPVAAGRLDMADFDLPARV
jgi:DNA-binding SARP family transcriptional activator